MSELSNIPDDEWHDFHSFRPQNGEVVASKRKGEVGYNSETIYIDGFFETYKNLRNRIVITRWKNNLWLPIKEGERR